MAIRSFIAVEISSSMKEEVSRAISVLGQGKPQVKWADPAATHITLKFLGNLTPGQLSRVLENLRHEFFFTGGFDIALGGIGVFPGWRRPRVIWVGLSSGVTELCRLAEGIESCLTDCGFPREDKKFSPHLTIGRVKGYDNIAVLRKAASELTLFPVDIRVDHFTVFRSELGAQGARHTPIERFYFQDRKVSP